MLWHSFGAKLMCLDQTFVASLLDSHQDLYACFFTKQFYQTLT